MTVREPGRHDGRFKIPVVVYMYVPTPTLGIGWLTIGIAESPGFFFEVLIYSLDCSRICCTFFIESTELWQFRTFVIQLSHVRTKIHRLFQSGQFAFNNVGLARLGMVLIP